METCDTCKRSLPLGVLAYMRFSKTYVCRECWIEYWEEYGLGIGEMFDEIQKYKQKRST